MRIVCQTQIWEVQAASSLKGFGDIHGPRPFPFIGFRWALISQASGIQELNKNPSPRTWGSTIWGLQAGPPSPKPTGNGGGAKTPTFSRVFVWRGAAWSPQIDAFRIRGRGFLLIYQNNLRLQGSDYLSKVDPESPASCRVRAFLFVFRRFSWGGRPYLPSCA